MLGNDAPAGIGTLRVIQGTSPGSGTVGITAGGSTTLVGIYGSLLLESDGNYIYTLRTRRPTCRA